MREQGILTSETAAWAILHLMCISKCQGHLLRDISLEHAANLTSILSEACSSCPSIKARIWEFDQDCVDVAKFVQYVNDPVVDGILNQCENHHLLFKADMCRLFFDEVDKMTEEQLNESVFNLQIDPFCRA